MSEEFKELKAPELGGAGWYIITKHGPNAWLNIHGEISSDTSDDVIKLLYHKTEGDAYRVMARYYEKHGRVHAAAMATSIADTTDVIESQVMTF